MKKVLIFSLAYFPSHTSGAEIAIQEITDRINDIEFHLITHRFEKDEPDEEKIRNVMVHRVGGGSSYLAKALFVPRAALHAIRLHRTAVFDGAWAMMSYMLLPVVIARLFGMRIPYAVSLQEGDTFEYMFGRLHIRPFLPVLRYGFRHATCVQAISTFLAGWARRMGYQREVEVIPNGVDVAHFSQDYPEVTIDDVKDMLVKKMGDVFLITTSRLVRKNGLDDVIRAMSKLPPNIHFYICGAGVEKESLVAVAQNAGVIERVHFLGKIAHADLPKYLRAADIFIRPSRSEGMGNSFIEAFAAGLPVIATQEGGIADFLFDEKRNPEKPITGWAVDKDSPQQIAEAVKDIMSRPEKVRAVVATAKEMVKENYDWDIVARSMRERVFYRLGM